MNPPSGADFEADIAAARAAGARGVVSAVRVAKVDSAAERRTRRRGNGRIWGIDRRLICQLESARAVA